MKTIKIFVIENEFDVVNLLREKFKPLQCEVLPTFFDSNADKGINPHNQRDMEAVYKASNLIELFNEVLKTIHDIDIFIVDISIATGDDDKLGINLLNHLGSIRKGYNEGVSKFVVLSQFEEFDTRFYSLDKNVVDEFFYKDSTSSYRQKIYNFINENYRLGIKENEKKKLKDRLINSEIFIENFIFKFGAKLLNGLILLSFGLLMLSAMLFAGWGIETDFTSYTSQFKMKPSADKESNDDGRPFINTIPAKKMIINFCDDSSYIVSYFVLKDSSQMKIYLELFSKDLNNKNKRTAVEKTEILEVVERIFIYLLPLFILFGFFNYYASTTAVRLRGGRKNDIDHDGSIKGINTSKIILLSALLSFTLISAIEQIFIKGETETKILISYAIFIIILMAFILLISKENPERKDKSE